MWGAFRWREVKRLVPAQARGNDAERQAQQRSLSRCLCDDETKVTRSDAKTGCGDVGWLLMISSPTARLGRPHVLLCEPRSAAAPNDLNPQSFADSKPNTRNNEAKSLKLKHTAHQFQHSLHVHSIAFVQYPPSCQLTADTLHATEASGINLLRHAGGFSIPSHLLL